MTCILYQVIVFLHYFWAGTLHAVAVFVILWLLYGPVSLIGMTVLLMLIPMQAAMGKLFTRLRCLNTIYNKLTLQYSPERVYIIHILCYVIVGSQLLR